MNRRPLPGGGTMSSRIRRVHFVGIGGIGMSGIAEVLANLGFDVSGSDLRATPVTQRLTSLGCRVGTGHSADQVEGADVVVVSSAIDVTNPEVRRARELGVPVIPRAEMLAELMRMKFSTAVAGSHGKTTTTSMVSILQHHAGLDPTVIIGGRLNIFGSNARLGSGEYLVAEADESDGSFLHLFPSLAIVTNIDAEHMGHYGTLENLRHAFIDFVNRVPFYGAAILCLDDPNVQTILPSVDRRVLTYGFTRSADLRAGEPVPEGEGSRFEAWFRGDPLGTFRLHVPGRHNVLNALATVATGLELGIGVPVIASALEEYRGVDRRFQTRGTARGVRVVDDYGHHPTEIRATLQAARSIAQGRVMALFQPHRFTRLRDHWDDFATSFYDADTVLVTDVYTAGEEPLDGISGETITEAIRSHGHRHVTFVGGLEALAAAAAREAREGDLVIAFGAGSITQACPLILQHLEGESPR